MKKIQLSQDHRAAVERRRRVICQEDANMPSEALGMDIEDWLSHRFDLIDQGAPVDSMFWDVGFAEDTYAVYNNSKLLPPLAHPGIDHWRRQGIDWVKKLVESSHSRGIEAFWSHRICAADLLDGQGRQVINPLKQAHPDWVNTCWWPQGLWNLASPELRAHKLAYFRELFELYDFDGLQLDFARHTPCLPPGREWENRHHATEFVWQTRMLLQELAERKKRPLLLAARVAENLQGNHRDGLEVERWAEENLVDIFVIGGRTTRVDIEGFKKFTAPQNIKVCPCFDGHHTDDGYYHPPVEHYRGVFLNWIRQGADSIGVFNWACAHEEVYDRLGLPGGMKSPEQCQILLELSRQSLLPQRDRIYAGERRGGYPWAQNYLYRNSDKPLPMEVHGAKRISIPVFIRETLHGLKCLSELSLVFWHCRCEDIGRAFLNGEPLELLSVSPHWRDGQIYCDRPQPTAGNWRSFPITENDLLKMDYIIPADVMSEGENSVTVEFTGRQCLNSTCEKVEIKLGGSLSTALLTQSNNLVSA